jgi:hypothetical protein
MATEAQINANRRNAQHSTGPKTEEGKARSAQNNARHGLCSREFVILPGQRQEFEEFMADLHQGVQPQGPIETEIFRHLAHAAWNLRRCRYAEADIQAALARPDCDTITEPDLEPRFRNIDLYARRAERTFYKALKEIKALQSERKFNADLKTLNSTKPTAEAAPPLSENLVVHEPFLRCAQAKQRMSDLELLRWIDGAPNPKLDRLYKLPPYLRTSPPKSSGHSKPIPPETAATAA